MKIYTIDYELTYLYWKLSDNKIKLRGPPRFTNYNFQTKKKLCCHHSQQKRLERRIKAESRIPRSRHVVISYATATYFMDTKIRTMNTGAFSLRHRARALKRGAREDHMRVRKGLSFQAGRVQTSLGNVNRA